MRTSFNGSGSEPRAVLYARATIDLASRDVRLEDVPCRNLEDVLGGFGRSFQILAERTSTNAFTPENPLIINTGALTASNVMTGLRTYFSAYSPLKTSNKGLPAAMWSAGSCKFGPKLKWTGLDEVILEGQADAPVYLVIRHSEQGPQIGFEPAGDLLGLTCNDKIMWLRDRYADAHFAAIGPAGEHYEDCYMAAVAPSPEKQVRSDDEKRGWAGSGGMGGVMGYKRVLAIVAQAPDRIAKLKPEIRDINKAASTGPGSRKFREKDKGGLGGTWSNYVPLEKFHFVPQNNFRPTGDGKSEQMLRDNPQP